MKEKFKKWLDEGKVSLALLWFNVLMMVGVITGGVIAGNYATVLLGFMVFMPWVNMFWGEYEHIRFKNDAVKLLAEQEKNAGILYGFVERYYKLCGELPKEIKEEQSKEEDHGKEN